MMRTVQLLCLVFLVAEVPLVTAADINRLLMGAAFNAISMKGKTRGLNSEVNVEKKGTNSFVDSWQSVAKTVSRTYNTITDVVDEHALEAILGQLVPGLSKSFEKNTCVDSETKEIPGEGELHLTGGKLNHQGSVKIIPKVIKPYIDISESLLNVELSFVFKDLTLDYWWKYKNERVMGKDREGTVQITLTGLNYVKVFGTVPKSRSDINHYVSAKEGFLRVSDGMVFDLRPEMAIEIFYDSFLKKTFGVGVTEGFVKGTINQIKNKIESDVEKALKILIVKSTSNARIFSNGEIFKVDTIVCNQQTSNIDDDF